MRLDRRAAHPDVDDRHHGCGEEPRPDHVELDDAEHAPDRDRRDSGADDGDALARQAGVSHRVHSISEGPAR